MSDKKSENFKNLHTFAQRGEETHQYKEGKWSSNPNNTNDKQVTKSCDLTSPKQAMSLIFERNKFLAQLNITI